MVMLQHCLCRVRLTVKQICMKKIIVLFGMLTLAAGFSVAGVKDDPADNKIAIVKSGSRIKVFYTAEGSRYAKVSILDAKGDAIFYDVVKTRNGFIRSYNTANLPSGNYVVRVSDSNGIRTQAFEIPHPKGMQYRVTRLNPQDKYLLSIPSGNAQVVRVKIFDEQSNVLYNGIEKLRGDFAKVYHVKNLKGAAHFEVYGN